MGSLVEAVAFRIGAESDAGNPFDGKLDDTRVYGFPLSADEVRKLYQTTAPMQVQLDSGLVGYWTFNGPDVKGSTVIDRSGKGNDGTITGAVPAKGKLGQGMGFDGSGDYIRVTDPAGGELDFGEGASFTLSLWFSRNTYTTQQLLLYKVSNGSSGEGYFVYIDPTIDDIVFRILDTDINAYEKSSKTTFTSNSWNHFVGVWADTFMKVYINGADDTDADPGNGPIEDIGSLVSTGNLNIGIGDGEGTEFTGRIDDVRIYNRALSETEITNLYTLGR
jgi:hypothetical protein